MRFLLASGLGPYTMSFKSLEGTLLAPDGGRALDETYGRLLGAPVDLAALTEGPGRAPLLRPYRGCMPHLPTESVRSIVEAAGVECEVFDLEDLWRRTGEPAGADIDVVGLSTTFICDAYTLSQTIAWLARRFPGVPIVLGGQYSNLKFADIPVRYYARGYGTTQISRFRHGWQLLKMVVFAWRKLVKG